MAVENQESCHQHQGLTVTLVTAGLRTSDFPFAGEFRTLSATAGELTSLQWSRHYNNNIYLQQCNPGRVVASLLAVGIRPARINSHLTLI